jgi:hypothetical protein
LAIDVTFCVPIVDSTYTEGKQSKAALVIDSQLTAIVLTVGNVRNRGPHGR